MRILPLDPADAETVAACQEVRADAMRADDPFEPPASAAFFAARLRAGYSDAPLEAWYVPGETDGSVAAWYSAEFPHRENQNRVSLNLTVHPELRRRGLGTALLRHAAAQAAAGGRVILASEVQEDSPGEAFTRQAGGALGQLEVRRVLDLPKIPASTIARLREGAAKAAAGYSLVRWEGLVPDERLDQVASLHNVLNDAPMDPGVEPTAWTADRVRGRMNSRHARLPARRYSLAAVHDASGEMAALTVMAVHDEVPDWGHQLLTAVTRPHRGHRLGLLVKAAMMDWLTAAEPAVERIVTWNAASNERMIAINEELGYQVWGRPYRSVELPVASVVKT
jgi:GNAT superfamily N-acetyltransferase